MANKRQLPGQTLHRVAPQLVCSSQNRVGRRDMANAKTWTLGPFPHRGGQEGLSHSSVGGERRQEPGEPRESLGLKEFYAPGDHSFRPEPWLFHLYNGTVIALSTGACDGLGGML